MSVASEGMLLELFGKTVSLLENSLDFATAKNKVIANNIANVDTPGYKAKNATFNTVLRDAINSGQIEAKRTNPKHLPFDTETKRPYQIAIRQNGMYNNNGNNVDIDMEMAELAKNQIYYQSLVDRLNGNFSSLQTVIRGGR